MQLFPYNLRWVKRIHKWRCESFVLISLWLRFGVRTKCLKVLLFTSGVVPKQESQKHQDWENTKDLQHSFGRCRRSGSSPWSHDLGLPRFNEPGRHIQTRPDHLQRGGSSNLLWLDSNLQQPSVVTTIFHGSPPSACIWLLKNFRGPYLGRWGATGAAAAAAPGSTISWISPRLISSTHH